MYSGIAETAVKVPVLRRSAGRRRRSNYRALKGELQRYRVEDMRFEAWEWM